MATPAPMPILRRWAFLAATVVCVLVAVVCVVRLAVGEPSLRLGSILTGDLLALLALAGVRRR